MPKNYVIKPIDLCDSAGVYLIKNNMDIKTNKSINKTKIINDLQKLRSSIFSEYYMHDKMFNGLIPYSGYIIEELLLDETNNIPTDFKCYIFGGKLYYIATTYNRRIINGVQQFDSVWYNRDWKPIKISMIKNGYKFGKMKKPKKLDNLIYLVEKMGKQLKRHCRIDVYIINDKIYLGEFTFFCGAILHTIYCNFILGIIWLINKDDYTYQDNKLKKLVPNYYNKI